jgi:endonuclease/exonuclease/phosphatase family metal-dependent hydrolase
MNDRVKAILLTALKLSPEERAELAQTLLDNLGTDPAEAEQLLAGDGDAPTDDTAVPARPTSDVLAKYLDI